MEIWPCSTDIGFEIWVSSYTISEEEQEVAYACESFASEVCFGFSARGTERLRCMDIQWYFWDVNRQKRCPISNVQCAIN